MTGTTDPAGAVVGTAHQRAMPTAAAAPPTLPVPPTMPAPLWRNRDFQLLSTGSTSAWVGMAMADVVFPLLILGFTGSPMLAAVFGVIQFAAMILGSLPAGTFIDRRDRRRILIGAETTRAVAGASLAVAIALGHVWLVQLYLVAAILGVCQPFGGVRTILVRSVVPAARLSRALAQQQVRAAAASLVGPAIGTTLYAAGRSLPFAVSAAALMLSAATAVLIRYRGVGEPEVAAEGFAAPASDASAASPMSEADLADGVSAPGPEPDSVPVPDSESAVPAPGAASAPDSASTSDSDSNSDSDSDGGVLAGLRILWGRPLMRSAMLIIMVVNLIGVPLDLVLIVQAKREGVPTHYIGLILAAFAAGAILGAPLTPHLHRLVSPGRLLIGFVGMVTLTLLLLAVPLGGFWMAGVIAVVGLVMPALEVLMQVLILQQVPDRQRGRVMSAAMMLMSLGMPLGSALGGLLLQLFSPTGALLFFAAITGVSTLIALGRRSLRAAAWPDSARTAG